MITARALVWSLVLLGIAGTGAVAAEQSRPAHRIVKASGHRAGLLVHAGVTDGKLTAELARSGNFLVHGLAADRAVTEKRVVEVAEVS